MKNWAVTLTYKNGEGIHSVIWADCSQFAAALAALDHIKLIEEGGGLSGVKVLAHNKEGEPDSPVAGRIIAKGLVAVLHENGLVSMYDDTMFFDLYITSFAPIGVTKHQFHHEEMSDDDKMTVVLCQASQMAEMQDYLPEEGLYEKV